MAWRQYDRAHCSSSTAVITHTRSSASLCECVFRGWRIKKFPVKQHFSEREYACPAQAYSGTPSRVWGFESWVVSPITSRISPNVTYCVEPAGLQRQWVNGWMWIEVEGRGSGEGTSAHTAMLNKQHQSCSHALGSQWALWFSNSLFSLHATSPLDGLHLSTQLRCLT